jgi:hypothetical protein
MPGKTNANRTTGSLLIWIRTVIAAWAAWTLFSQRRLTSPRISYTEFIKQV